MGTCVAGRRIADCFLTEPTSLVQELFHRGPFMSSQLVLVACPVFVAGSQDCMLYKKLRSQSDSVKHPVATGLRRSKPNAFEVQFKRVERVERVTNLSRK